MQFPVHFEPFLRPMVWGGRRLGDFLKQPLPEGELYGECWSVSDHALHHSQVAGGPLAGQSLRSLVEHHAAALLGASARGAPFPWLIKFLDARDWLSVQVHPDDAAAARLWPGEQGKTEAWFVLDAAPGSRIFAGLLPGVDQALLRERLQQGRVADCLHHFEPRPGDFLFLPAGTVHAVGGGVLFAEVQQTSDATFRLFDWDRRDARGQLRPLHIEQSLACIDWSRGPVHPTRLRGFAAPDARPGPGIRQPLAECPYFNIEYVDGAEPFPCGGTGRLQALVVCRGSGRLRSAHAEEALVQGQSWIFPAAMPPAQCQPTPTLKALLCTLP